MKPTIHALFLILLTFSCAGLFAQDKKSKSKSPPPVNDEVAIRATIEKETKAFFEIDQKTWASLWVHEPYAFWSFADTTDVNSFSGWEDISKGFNNYFKTSKPSTANIKRDWHHIKIQGNMAYIRFTQQVTDDSNRPPQAEVRVMEKVNGEWRIVCVSVIAVQKDNEPVR